MSKTKKKQMHEDKQEEPYSGTWCCVACILIVVFFLMIVARKAPVACETHKPVAVPMRGVPFGMMSSVSNLLKHQAEYRRLNAVIDATDPEPRSKEQERVPEDAPEAP